MSNFGQEDEFYSGQYYEGQNQNPDMSYAQGGYGQGPEHQPSSDQTREDAGLAGSGLSNRNPRPKSPNTRNESLASQQKGSDFVTSVNAGTTKGADNAHYAGLEERLQQLTQSKQQKARTSSGQAHHDDKADKSVLTHTKTGHAKAGAKLDVHEVVKRDEHGPVGRNEVAEMEERLFERFEERWSSIEQSIQQTRNLVWGLIFLCVIVIGFAVYALQFTSTGDILPLPESRLNEVENKLRFLQDRIKQIENAAIEGKDRIKQLNEAKKQLELAMSNTERILSDTTGTLYRTNEMQKIIHENTFHKGAVTAVIIIIFIAVAAIGFYVCVYRPWQPRNVSQAYTSEAKQALNAVPPRPVLGSTVCIISFKSNRSAAYQALVRSALSSSGCADTMHEITKHTDISRLPHCKMYIMCVEFSERHVIIEEPGLALGDMKRTTYEAVEKLGGVLVILYVNHRGSSHIQDLYSTEIYCVNRQPQLKALETRSRFISTYDQVNDRQKDALRQAVREALN